VRPWRGDVDVQVGVDPDGDARPLPLCDVVMPSPFCDQAWTARRRAGGQHGNGSGATGSYQVTVARWRCPWRPQRESTGLATRHKASGTTGQTLATTTTARSLQTNKGEHRLFSHISMNWRGRPLTSHEVIVELIAATQTHAGLKVRAELDRRSSPPGVKISDRDLAAVPLHRHGWHGEWNDTVLPAAA
jgi:Rhodopirellula transposase DDE domain